MSTQNIVDRLSNKLNCKTDKELSDLLDVRRTTLSSWRSKSSIPIEKLTEIARKYDLSLDYLVLGKVQEKKSSLDKELLGKIALQFEIAYKALEERNGTAAWLIADDLLSDEELQKTQPSDDEIKAVYEECHTRQLLALLIGNTYSIVADIEDEQEQEKEIKTRALNHAFFLKNPHLNEKIKNDTENIYKSLQNKRNK